MSNDKNDTPKPGQPGTAGQSSGGSQAPGSGSKRPTATIDLEAKEIEIRDTSKPGATTSSATAAGSVPPVAPKSENTKAGKPFEPARDTKPATASASTVKTIPPQARTSGGLGIGRLLSYLVAGGIGALLTLFGADLAATQLGIRLPTPGATQITDLTERVNTLNQRVQEAQIDVASSDLRERLRQVQVQLDSVAAAGKQATAALGGVQSSQEQTAAQLVVADKRLSEALGVAPADRLAKLELTFDTMAKAAADGDKGKLPQLAGLIARLDALENALDSRLEVVQRSVADGLQKQQVRLEERLASVDKPVELETVKAATKQLGEAVVGVKANAEKLAQDIQQTQVSGTQLREELAALKQQAANIDAAMKGEFDKVVKADQLGSVTTTLGKLQADLGQVVAKEQVREESANRIVLALELANLKRAIERGGSFERELVQVKAVAPADIDLAVLAANAKTGLPTQALLTREFRDTARAIVAADAAPAEDGSLLDRLVAGARSVVHVRKTGMVEGQTAEAVVARMEGKLADGDLEATLKEAETLGGSAREAAASWLDKLSARLAVDRAMVTVDEGLRKVISTAAP